MPSSTPNLSDSLHEFDKSKNYKRVVFQQGKPILDVDLNDMTEAIESQTQSLLIEKMGFGPPQLDYREWAIRSVDGNPLSNRNQYNMSFTLGRLDTRLGIIDTAHLKESDASKESAVIFDSHQLKNVLNLEVSTDRLFSNYLLKGKVTASNTTSIKDDNKNFVDQMKITGFTRSNRITPEYQTVFSQVNADNTSNSTLPSTVQVSESACRVVFVGNITSALTGLSREVNAITSNQLEWSSALPVAPSVGDEYYVIPANTLSEYKTLYDAVQTRQASYSEGLSGLPQLMPYVQVFEEDISSEEDTDIQSTLLGSETTHRTQLRWCVRVAKVKISIDGDQDSSVNVGNLKLAHIYSRFNEISEYEYQTTLDSVDKFASNDPTFFQTHFWQERRSDNGSLFQAQLNAQGSPWSSLGLTPMHFFNNEEISLDRLVWGLLKAETLSALDSLNGFNDVQVLALFNSESKTNTGDPANETLDPIFYPNKVRDTTEPIVHPFLSQSFPVDEGFSFDYTEVRPGSFKAPPKIFMPTSDLNTDIVKSRGLFGYKGGLILGPTSPVVFKSLSEHMSFLDQVVLGLSGLGSAQGYTSGVNTNRLPGATNYFLDPSDLNNSYAQSGYGIGAIKPDTVISGVVGSGFDGSLKKYYLRDKGARSSHTVNWDDEDLGWSIYKRQGSDLEGVNDPTDLTVRSWDEGLQQAVALERGINFRKLAIKTVAHKSADLFTVSEVPANQNVNFLIPTSTASKNSAISYQFPQDLTYASTMNLSSIDSYSGVASNQSNKNPLYFRPTSLTDFDLPALVDTFREDYKITHGGTRTASNTDLSAYYGPWNRFDSSVIQTDAGSGNASNVPLDLWANRCTAMRLRYHIGDFYPGSTDSQGIPANRLVDSLNLFVKVEPLSLAHWMTMPKHQHSILENSFSMAEGIEALLKVSHGLGDVQKLMNSQNQPLVQSTSPSHVDGLPDPSNLDGSLVQTTVGDVDPLDLPFDYHAHPFVHWYHPAQHLIKGPHPSGDRFTGGEKYTVYPKFGRRSMIIPALVPFEGIGDTDTLDTFPSTVQNLLDGRTSLHSDTDGDLTAQSGNEMAVIKTNVNSVAHLDRSVFPYLPHSTRSGDTDSTVSGGDQVVNYTGGSFTIRENSFVFPHVPQDNQDTVPGPVFIPASRQYAQQDYSELGGQAEIGFYKPYLTEQPYTKFPNDLSELDGSAFPFDEYTNYYDTPDDNLDTPSTEYQTFINRASNAYQPWSVPALRAAVRTTTVAEIVKLTRTSFTTALSSSTLPSEYAFVMPAKSHDAFARGIRVPGFGPDSPVDTLFVGDTGTATGGRLYRSGFMNPLNLGMGGYMQDLGLANNNLEGGGVVRDSFEYSRSLMDSATLDNSAILSVFNALNRQGLQQKLMWNSSFRILHHRPNGFFNQQGDCSSTAPKSLTEIFLCHDRRATQNGQITNVPFTGTPNSPNKKPYINLLATHPASSALPGSYSMNHLYSMVSDSVGGPHTPSAYTDTSGIIQYNYNNASVATSSMGDTFGVDPFDYAMSEAFLGTNNPMRQTETSNRNTGIEIELLHELDRAFTNQTALNLDSTATLNGTNFKLIDTMPSANELTLPGDHEIVFVLYTGHYGLKIHDTNDDVDVSYIPSVAGCHLSATIEVNRPSEKIDSTSTDEHHYGFQVDSNPIKTYSIMSTKE